MTRRKQQEASVRDYFDRMAPGYTSTFYDGVGKLHDLRMGLALENCNLEGKRVLDIGAGTGELYNRIADTGISAYVAIESSEAMASRSQIPEENLFLSSFENFNSPETFDLIFALGVHSYLDDELEVRLWSFIKAHLSDRGRAAVSFTNSHCLANHLRISARTVFSHLRPWPQHPSVRTVSYHDLRAGGMEVSKPVYFNPVFSFLPSITRVQSRAFLYTDFLCWFC